MIIPNHLLIINNSEVIISEFHNFSGDKEKPKWHMLNKIKLLTEGIQTR